MNKKKNLLFIFADQWRADAIGYAQADPMQPTVTMRSVLSRCAQLTVPA